MKKLLKISVIAALGFTVVCGFAKTPQRRALPAARESAGDVEPPHDSLRSLYLYTDALKRGLIDSNRTEAFTLLRQAVERDSTYGPAWYELAGSAMFSEPDSAVLYAGRAVESDSTNKWYLQRLGQSLLVAHRYGEAVPVFERLVTSDRNPDNFRILAMLYEQNDRPFSAIAILDSADGQFGSLPGLSDIKRRLLLSTRQFDKALNEARRAAEAVPYAPENHIALGEIYERRGEDSLALASFRKAVAVDSSSLFAWAALGDYYLRRKEHAANLNVTQHLFTLDDMPLDDKIDVFRRLTVDRRFYREYYPQINRLAATLFIKYPDAKEVVELYARHLIDSGLVEQALEVYKSHFGDEPPQLDYYTMASSIETYLGRPDSADRYLAMAVERFPASADVHIRRGGSYMMSKRWDEALASFNTALKYADSDSLRSEILGYTGDVYHSRSEGRKADMKRCYAAYEKALKANPDNATVLNNYAYFMSLEGRSLERALKMSERATELVENNATYIDTRAWVLYCLGRYDEAKRLMRTALSLDASNSPELRLHYGDILAAIGESYMAEVYWRRALEAGYTDAAAIEARIEKLHNQQTR